MAALANPRAQTPEKRVIDDRSFELWYGRLIPKSMPTWIHGLLQFIINKELEEAGFIAAPEVELRIVADAHPRPDIVAVNAKPSGSYACTAVDIVVEILSADDTWAYLKEKLQKYEEWGCGLIYPVDPGDRSIMRWQHGTLQRQDDLAGVPASRIWSALDARYNS